jgi:hypothetical protein
MKSNSPWRKSSFSSGAQSACVEVATADGVLVRDTTDRAGFTLTVTPSAWQAFVSGLRKLAADKREGRPGHRSGPFLRSGVWAPAPRMPLDGPHSHAAVFTP